MLAKADTQKDNVNWSSQNQEELNVLLKDSCTCQQQTKVTECIMQGIKTQWWLVSNRTYCLCIKHRLHHLQKHLSHQLSGSGQKKTSSNDPFPYFPYKVYMSMLIYIPNHIEHTFLGLCLGIFAGLYARPNYCQSHMFWWTHGDVNC